MPANEQARAELERLRALQREKDALYFGGGGGAPHLLPGGSGEGAARTVQAVMSDCEVIAR